MEIKNVNLNGKSKEIRLYKNEIKLHNKNTLSNKNKMIDNEYISKIGVYGEFTSAKLRKLFNINNISPLLMKLKKFYKISKTKVYKNKFIYKFTLIEKDRSI